MTDEVRRSLEEMNDGELVWLATCLVGTARVEDAPAVFRRYFTLLARQVGIVQRQRDRLYAVMERDIASGRAVESGWSGPLCDDPDRLDIDRDRPDDN
jgi:hypothetical protein